MPPGKRSRAVRTPPRLPVLEPAILPRDDLSDDALLRGLRFGSEDLSGRAGRLIDVEGCHFVGTTMAAGRLDKVTAVDTVFETCDLANLELEHSSMSRVELTGCRITGLRAPSILMRQVLLRDCVAEMTAFRFATLTRVWFVDCRMLRADFGSADLTSAVFRRCDLTGADLSQVKARGAVFVDCRWEGVRGITDLAGATVVHGSAVDEHDFMAGLAASLGILLGDAADYPEE